MTEVEPIFIRSVTFTPGCGRFRPGRSTSAPVRVVGRLRLTDSLGRIAGHKITELDGLMPWSYAQHRA